MSIDDLLKEAKEEESKSLKERLDVGNSESCPDCGSNNTEKKEYYWRCREPRNKCEVITFIPA